MQVVEVDDLLEYVIGKWWCDMAVTQKELLDDLFKRHDDGDGKLSIAEFSLVVQEATPEVELSQAELIDMYKRCLAKSAELQAAAMAGGGGAGRDSDGGEDGEVDEDAITPAAFEAVVLPYLLREIQQGL